MSDLVYGYHVVTKLLQFAPERVLELYFVTDNPRLKGILQQAKSHNIHISKVNKSTLSQWFKDAAHQGIAARITRHSICEADLLNLVKANQKPLLLILDGVQDPHNLGACLRSSEAFGVTAVIAPKDGACSMSATVRKVACGADLLVPYIQVSNLSRTIKELQKLGIWIVGTSFVDSENLNSLDLTIPIAIVIGSESTGLRSLTLKNCDFLGHIPMHGAIESLNMSVAAGICLYEVSRQRLIV